MEQTLNFMARPGFMVREVAGENLLIAIDTGNVRLSGDKKLPSFNGMVRLNTLGLFLWKALEQPRTIDQLAAAVEESFDAEGQDVRGDIAAFLDTGVRNQLIFLIPDKGENNGK